MADPLTIAALVMGGAKLIGGVGSGIANIQRTAPNQAVLDEIARLERLQQADALGLTGTERSAFLESFTQPVAAMQQQQMAQSQALQATAQDSGEQLRRMRAAEEQTQRAAAEANRQVEILNQQQARAQEAQLLQLQMAEEQRQAERKAAITETVTAGLVAGGQLASQGIALSELADADPGAYNANQLMAIGQMYGYSFPTYGQGAQGYPVAGQQMIPPGYYGYYPNMNPGAIPGTQTPVYTTTPPPTAGAGEGAIQGTGEGK